ARRVPVVAMTANLMPDQVRAFARAGMNAHIAKPFDRATLCEAVARQLSSVVLLETGEAGPRPTRPAVFDRAAYDGLRANLGFESAKNTLNAFVGILGTLSETIAAPEARSEAATVAAAAAPLGFLDLANAYARLATAAEGAETDAALRRCRVARDLAHRTLHELTGPERPEVGPTVALL
ncbi:MAG TPA: hypothetical protein VF606_03630, partial [Geminicoccaceae bacterium]